METTKEILKRLVVDALRASEQVKLSLNLEFKGIKFDEDRPMVLLNLDTYNGLSIGDPCVVERQILRYSDDFILPVFPDIGIIAAFVELIGHLRYGKGIKIKDMFCILAAHFKTPPGTGRRIVKTYVAQTDTTIIHLFSVGGLQKIKQ